MLVNPINRSRLLCARYYSKCFPYTNWFSSHCFYHRVGAISISLLELSNVLSVNINVKVRI